MNGVIEDAQGNPICRAISQRTFHLTALGLEHGPNFHVDQELCGWASTDNRAVGMVSRKGLTYGFIVLRRRLDNCWTLKGERDGFKSVEMAIDALCDAMEIGSDPEPIPLGIKRRPPLFTRPGKGTFKLLMESYTHLPARWAIEEVYHALPKPDANFVSDMQNHCEARLWELYLFACFKEQGIQVSQDEPSPDFLISASGSSAYVEAVTAHSPGQSGGGPSVPTIAPTLPEERMAGSAAERFAKTLRSKLQREYENLAHVVGKPFAIALADFHAPSSMVWSREAMPTYLYGAYPVVVETPQGRVVEGRTITHLSGSHLVPAGIFRNPEYSNLSAVIFSNAGTIAKFNRMGFLAGNRPPGLSMSRAGNIYDRTPGALEGIKFDSNILSDEYEQLWPGGEKWCQELEVYHNPLAAFPFPEELLPGATHWFEQDGEILCRSPWENVFLASLTSLFLDQEAFKAKGT